MLSSPKIRFNEGRITHGRTNITSAVEGTDAFDFPQWPVEELHAKGESLTDETMRILNMDINNRFYTLLSLWFNGTEEDNAKLESTLNFLARFYGWEWDKAQRIKLI